MASNRHLHGSSPSTPLEKPSTPQLWTPHPKTSPWTPSPARKRIALLNSNYRKIAGCFLLLVCVAFFQSLFFRHKDNGLHRPSYLTDPQSIAYNATILPNAAFQPPESMSHRLSDTIDTFSSYKYRSTCNISSLDLHAPFAPLCSSRKELLQAMSDGGRIGLDAPYMPRGCDMRWFSTEEVCEILSRFERVIILGDSMMRHVIGSLNVLVRKDLGYGAVTDWNFTPEERRDCFCNYQFNVKQCSLQGIFRTADVLANDPDSIACPALPSYPPPTPKDPTPDITIELITKFPVPDEELQRFKDDLPATKPKRPYAFVFGHGLWNDLDLQASMDWLDLLLDTAVKTAPWLVGDAAHSSSASTKAEKARAKSHRRDASARRHERKRETGFFPRLFMTPNAAGKEKPDEWIVSQGNKALMIFEESVRIEVGRRGVEHLGTWNMSAQSVKFDGVHLDLKGNMIKAMMVLNWLNMLEVERF